MILIVSIRTGLSQKLMNKLVAGHVPKRNSRAEIGFRRRSISALQDFPSRLFWSIGAGHGEPIGTHHENRRTGRPSNEMAMLCIASVELRADVGDKIA